MTCSVVLLEQERLPTGWASPIANKNKLEEDPKKEWFEESGRRVNLKSGCFEGKVSGPV